MRSGSKACLFFKYSATEKCALQIIRESDKNNEGRVIKTIKKIMNSV